MMPTVDCRATQYLHQLNFLTAYAYRLAVQVLLVPMVFCMGWLPGLVNDSDIICSGQPTLQTKQVTKG